MPHPQPPTVILLASVLKPLDDTRMFGKFGCTLAGRPDTVVHVAGREAPRPASAPANLHTHTLLRGTRLSWARLQAQARYWQLLQQVQPQLVVVHAPELLPLTLLWQALGRRQFLYDVRENYALNIRTQPSRDAAVGQKRTELRIQLGGMAGCEGGIKNFLKGCDGRLNFGG